MPPTSASLTPTMRGLFEEPNFASLATVCPDGHPQVSPVWIDIDGDEILVNTANGRVKTRNMQREPRVAVTVFNMQNPYQMVTVQGRVVDSMDGQEAEDHIDKLSRKYTGSDYPRHGDRMIFRIRPERIAGMGL